MELFRRLGSSRSVSPISPSSRGERAPTVINWRRQLPAQAHGSRRPRHCSWRRWLHTTLNPRIGCELVYQCMVCRSFLFIWKISNWNERRGVVGCCFVGEREGRERLRKILEYRDSGETERFPAPETTTSQHGRGNRQAWGFCGPTRLSVQPSEQPHLLCFPAIAVVHCSVDCCVRLNWAYNF